MAGRPRIDDIKILNSVDDRGVTVREVSLNANCSYGTAYNKLKEFERKGLVLSFRDNGRVKWKKVRKGRALAVEYVLYEAFSGEKIKRIRRVGDGLIIKLFDHTPQGKLKEDDIVCPSFIELKWANGCMFSCSWCYLQGTFRFSPRGKKPYEKPREKVDRHLNTFFENSEYPEMLNAGEVSDSLLSVSENSEDPFSKYIVKKFETQSRHKVLLLTKSIQIDNLLEVSEELGGNIRNTVVSFTINASPVSKRWEKGAPHPFKRIEAARKLYDAGYRIRFRIDPIVPIDGWEDSYEKLINYAFRGFRPERITLGSLRGLQTTINNCKDRSWVKYLSENSKWGMKVDFNTRFENYNYIIEFLENYYDYRNIALCKETRKMWDSLGLDYRKIRCNCLM
jgi:spore photoproduct lyase